MVEVLAPEDLVEADDWSDLSTSDLGPGARLGRYELLLPIAFGGMARVWAARMQGQRGFTKLVAIKTILPHLARDPEFERMFLDEARIASGVHHPNVCEIYELGEEGRCLYLAMEWVNGESLVQLLRAGMARAGADKAPAQRATPIEPRIAARIAADACAGLHAAHNLVDDDGQPLGVVHRDVSPHNILVSIDGTVKVTDFGVAKALGQSHSATLAGQIKGKVSYMAPEQITGTAVDRRSDVYAIGCVLYEATTGAPPFRGENDLQIMQAVLKGHYMLPTKAVPGYPPELAAIVARALAANAGTRYGDAEKMRVALEDWLARSGSLVTPSQVAAVVRQRSGVEIDRRREHIRRATGPTEKDGSWPGKPRASSTNEGHTPSARGPKPQSRSGVVPAAVGATPGSRSKPVGAVDAPAPPRPRAPSNASMSPPRPQPPAPTPAPAPAAPPAPPDTAATDRPPPPDFAQPGAPPPGARPPAISAPAITPHGAPPPAPWAARPPVSISPNAHFAPPPGLTPQPPAVAPPPAYAPPPAAPPAMLAEATGPVATTPIPAKASKSYLIAAVLGVAFAGALATGTFLVWRTMSAPPEPSAATALAPSTPPQATHEPAASAPPAAMAAATAAATAATTAAGAATSASAAPSTPAPASADIAFEVIPDSAEMLVDGVARPVSERTIPRPPTGKTVVVVFRATGYWDDTTKIDDTVKGPVPVILVPSASASAPPPPTIPGAWRSAVVPATAATTAKVTGAQLPPNPYDNKP